MQNAECSGLATTSVCPVMWQDQNAECRIQNALLTYEISQWVENAECRMQWLTPSGGRESASRLQIADCKALAEG